MATVKDILGKKGRNVVTIVPDDSVLTAAKLMNQKGIGGVVVVEDGEVVGVFTERDVLRRVVAERRDPAKTLISEVMTSPVFTCRLEAGLDECRALVTEKRVRHLPVVDADGLCGIVTSGDLLAFRAEEQADTIEYLNSYMFDIRS
jgi:CBS domain-containing protein